jgi:ATP-dependent protease ClpP protease subunit
MQKYKKTKTENITSDPFLEREFQEQSTSMNRCDENDDENICMTHDPELRETNDNDTTDTFDHSSRKTRQTIHAYHVTHPYEESIFIAGDKEVHFNARIDDVSITRMKKLISIIVDDNKDQLVKYDADKKVPNGREKDLDMVITYIVNSPGGSVHDVLDFVDYINHLRDTYYNIKFTSIITGMVASAGTVMCVIADKRHMTRFAFAMIHELSTGLARSNYTHIMTHAEFIKNLHDVLVIIYQEYRGIDPCDVDKKKELENLLKDQVWMTPKKYKELGFIDEIIASYDVYNKRLRGQ